MSDARATSALDFVLGRKLRAARADAGLSQQALAAKLGITFQQIQKYEKGANRIAASRLVSIAGVLGKPVSYFLEDAKEAAGAVRPGAKVANGLSSAEQTAMAALLAAIDDRRARRRALAALRSIVEAEIAKRPVKAKRAAAARKPKKPTKSRRA